MDQARIKEALTSMLEEVAEKAKADARAGESDIGSIFREDSPTLTSLDVKAVEEAIADVNKATATKEGTRRLVNGLFLAAKVAARVAFPS